MKLGIDYYRNADVVNTSKDLVGKVLCSNVDGTFTSGIITETEAYNGVEDKACHAYDGRRTKRTETMYQPGGIAYVYLCYGIHHLFNIVVGRENEPKATLIRGIRPLEGIDVILDRRGKLKIDKTTSAGPGTASQALGITTKLNATDLQSDLIWIEDRNIEVPENEVQVGPRIGVDYAGSDALLPYRFLWTSKKTEL